MARCATCGNDYDKTFDIIHQGQRKTFDCFECAIQAIAPPCSHCGCKIIGHGVEVDGAFYCCNHCASRAAAEAGEARPHSVKSRA